MQLRFVSILLLFVVVGDRWQLIVNFLNISRIHLLLGANGVMHILLIFSKSAKIFLCSKVSDYRFYQNIKNPMRSCKIVSFNGYYICGRILYGVFGQLLLFRNINLLYSFFFQIKCVFFNLIIYTHACKSVRAQTHTAFAQLTMHVHGLNVNSHFHINLSCTRVKEAIERTQHQLPNRIPP